MLLNRILFATAYLGSLFYVYYYGGKVPYMLFYLMTAVLILSFAYSYITNKKFTCSQSLDRNDALKGETIFFKFNVRNDWFLFAPYLKVIFRKTNKYFCSELTERNISLLPKREADYNYKIDCLYRGRYEVSIDKVITEDFLGIFRFTKEINKIYPVVVHPNIIQLDLASFNSDLSSEVSMDANKHNNDSLLVSDVRDYVYGDSLRRVHWKLSGKYDKLLVKNYQGTTDFNNMLVLDLTDYSNGAEDHIIVEDKVIETLISIANYFTSQQMAYELIYYDNGIKDMTINNVNDFGEVYDIMTEIAFVQKVPITDLLTTISTEMKSKSNFIFITTAVDYSICARMIESHESGNIVTLIYVNSQTVADELTAGMLSELDDKHIRTVTIDINSDIKEVLENTAAKNSGL